MKVKDILEFLKNVNPDDEVIAYDPDEWRFYTCSIKRYKNCVCIEHDYTPEYKIVPSPEEYVEEKTNEQ